MGAPWVSRSAARACAGLAGFARRAAGFGWQTSRRPLRPTKTRFGLAARIIPIAALPGLSTREAPQWAQSCAGDLRIGYPHASIDLQSADAEIEQHRAAIGGARCVPRPVRARSAPHTGFMAQRSAGRQSAIRWLHLFLVVVSKAISFRSGRRSMRGGPRAVAERQAYRPPRRVRPARPDRARRTRWRRRCRGSIAFQASTICPARKFPQNEFTFAHDRQPTTEFQQSGQAGADHPNRGSPVQRACPRSSPRYRRGRIGRTRIAGVGSRSRRPEPRRRPSGSRRIGRRAARIDDDAGAIGRRLVPDGRYAEHVPGSRDAA